MVVLVVAVTVAVAVSRGATAVEDADLTEALADEQEPAIIFSSLPLSPRRQRRRKRS